MDKWVQERVQVPDRRVLAGLLLDAEVKGTTEQVAKKVRGKMATGQCDGWKNVVKTRVVTSMMTVENEVSNSVVSSSYLFLSIRSQTYLVCTHDMTGQPKTGDKLYELTTSDITYMKDVFGVDVIAYCTDDGPDGKKMRRLLQLVFIWIIVLVCWAHQVNLIVGDYLTGNPALKTVINQGLEVIKWFNGHSTAHNWLREEQLIDRPHALILILPVIT